MLLGTARLCSAPCLGPGGRAKAVSLDGWSDLPVVSADLLRLLIDVSDGYDVVIPRSEGGYEPLCAVYSRNCLDPIRSQLEQDNLRIRAFFPEVRVKVVDQELLKPYDSDRRAFFNINTDRRKNRTNVFRRRSFISSQNSQKVSSNVSHLRIYI